MTIELVRENIILKKYQSEVTFQLNCLPLYSVR